MLLEIIVKRGNEVLGQLIPAAFRAAGRVAGLTWPPQVSWPLLRLAVRYMIPVPVPSPTEPGRGAEKDPKSMLMAAFVGASAGAASRAR
jgi:hypothetical protein